MDARHPEFSSDSSVAIGLVLRGQSYQGTFEYSVVSETHAGKLEEQTSNLLESILYRPLPLWSVWRVLLAGFFVYFVSLSVWQGWVWDLSVSRLSSIHHGQIWRILTAQFQHADSRHLLSNLLPFIGVGWLLWGYFGVIAFPIAPIAMGALANFVAIFTYPIHVNIVGISGTVFSMAGLWAMLYVKNDVRFSVPKRAIRALGFLLVLFFPLSLEERVADRVHILGGALGLLIGFIGWGRIKPQIVNSQKSSSKRVRVL
ncbi:MAG: hypothetical protein RJB13_1983 [Pseudomonadota bacterium]